MSLLLIFLLVLIPRGGYTLDLLLPLTEQPSGNSGSGMLTELTDINDSIPLLTSGLDYEVQERLPAGTAVFTLTANAGPFGLDGLRYILFGLRGGSGRDYGNTTVFRVSEKTGVVTLCEELDYETETFYTATVQIRAIGTGNRHADFRIRINVINEPDSAPHFVLTPKEVTHPSTTIPTRARNDTIAQVSATDDDADNILSYHILSIAEQGNGGVPPLFTIDRASGRIYMQDDQTFTPEARFTLNLRVYDNSQFNLTGDVTLTVEVLPEQLQFEQPSYTISISEGVSTGSELTRLRIRALSVSSQISYILDMTSPLNQADLFSVSGNGGAEAVISLSNIRGFDREDVDLYRVTVTAQRTDPIETATAVLRINILDENDNSPVFIDGDDPVIYVKEGIASQTVISQINATDRDIGNNGRVQFSLQDISSLPLPFSINRDTGVLTVIGGIDYETVQSFTLTVMVQDSADTLPLSSTANYTVQVININDNFPQFTAMAYFGEIYSRAQANDLVHHIVLTVTDADDVDNQQQLNFEIYFSELSSPDARAGYLFEVTEQPPYRVRVVSLPEVVNPAPKLLSLRVSVGDSVHSTNVRLFICVFVTDNVVFFDLNGVSKDVFQSCGNPDTSLCHFLDVLGEVVTEEKLETRSIHFSNDSVIVDNTNPNMITLGVYGWFGDELNAARENNGELTSQATPNVPEYLFYSSNKKVFDNIVEDSRLFAFSFQVTTREEITQQSPSLVVVVCGGVVLILLILLVIMIIICRRNNNRTRRRRRHSMLLTTCEGSDLAYRTMYDDGDDIFGSNQAMPGDENYNGDTERSQGRMPASSKGAESAAAESAMEMETNFDQQLPMQPGQRMGEFDMFARPDSDQP